MAVRERSRLDIATVFQALQRQVRSRLLGFFLSSSGGLRYDLVLNYHLDDEDFSMVRADFVHHLVYRLRAAQIVQVLL